jgi:hypothetical protein
MPDIAEVCNHMMSYGAHLCIKKARGRYRMPAIAEGV